MGKGSRNRTARSETKQNLAYREVRREVLREVNKELSRATDRFYYDEVTIILWVLHQQFGFGKDRLKKFYVNYNEENQKLRDHYSASDKDLHYITSHLLKQIGVDIDGWEKELSKAKPKEVG